MVLGEDQLRDLPDLLARRCPAAHYAIVSDSTVTPLYAQGVAVTMARVARTTLLTFPAGECNKTRATWHDLTDRLLASGMGRDGAIIAVGGGVVGDLAGFVAATYLRGIPYVQVPTTLLAMIDSAVGGKTGVDTPAGKNLVGAFHQPRLVLADTGVLRTLPQPHLLAGLAEAVKHGAIADRAYLEWVVRERERILAHDPETLHHLVRRSVEIKAGVVAADERDRGRRAILNLGHTVAHALEAITGYELLHGEAVAIGLDIEAAIGEAVGVTAAESAAALRHALSTLTLRRALPGSVDADRLLDIMHHDKKARETTVRFALLRSLGEAAQTPEGDWTFPAPDAVIRAALTQPG